MRSLKKILSVADIYTIVFFTLLLIQTIVFFNRLESPMIMLLQNVGIILGIVGISYYDKYYNKNKIIHVFRNLYHVVILLISYNTVQVFIEIVHPQLYDSVVANWDMQVFGFHACQQLYAISNPILTEYLQLCYFSYYFVAIALGVELFFKDGGKYFEQYLRYIVFSFIFLFMLYYALPVLGPRFYLYDFSQLSSDLPGLFFTEPMRHIINVGCNVPDPSNFTFAQVNPDCVPSGHTWIELIMLVMAFKSKSRLRWFYLVIGAGLIFSTLYLRYHYLFDLLLGVLFFLITYYLEPKLAKLINNKR